MDQNVRLRLTVKSAKELSKRDLFQYPSPFCRITIDGSGTAFKTDHVTHCSRVHDFENIQYSEYCIRNRRHNPHSNLSREKSCETCKSHVGSFKIFLCSNIHVMKIDFF